MLDEKTSLPMESEAIRSCVTERTVDFSPNLCIHHLLEVQVERAPDAIALAAPERGPLTYRRFSK